MFNSKSKPSKDPQPVDLNQHHLAYARFRRVSIAHTAYCAVIYADITGQPVGNDWALVRESADFTELEGEYPKVLVFPDRISAHQYALDVLHMAPKDIVPYVDIGKKGFWSNLLTLGFGSRPRIESLDFLLKTISRTVIDMNMAVLYSGTQNETAHTGLRAVAPPTVSHTIPTAPARIPAQANSAVDA